MTSVQQFAAWLGVVKELLGQMEAARCCEVAPRLWWADRDIKHKAAGAILITLCLSCCRGYKADEGCLQMTTQHAATWREVRGKVRVRHRNCFNGDSGDQTGGCEISKQVCSWWSVLWRRELERHSFWHSLLTGGPPPQSCSCLSCLFELHWQDYRGREAPRSKNNRVAPGAKQVN